MGASRAGRSPTGWRARRVVAGGSSATPCGSRRRRYICNMGEHPSAHAGLRRSAGSALLQGHGLVKRRNWRRAGRVGRLVALRRNGEWESEEERADEEEWNGV